MNEQKNQPTAQRNWTAEFEELGTTAVEEAVKKNQILDPEKKRAALNWLAGKQPAAPSSTLADFRAEFLALGLTAVEDAVIDPREFDAGKQQAALEWISEQREAEANAELAPIIHQAPLMSNWHG